MAGLEISLTTLTDKILTQRWTRDPYRHFELAVRIHNRTEERSRQTDFEIVIPEDIIFDFHGSAWQPTHRHEVDGIIFEVWSTGRPGTSPGGSWEERLAVNLKPYVQSALILRKLFQDGDPLSDWIKETVTFKQFVPKI